jgi:hypothetical protein
VILNREFNGVSFQGSAKLNFASRWLNLMAFHQIVKNLADAVGIHL